MRVCFIKQAEKITSQQQQQDFLKCRARKGSPEAGGIQQDEKITLSDVIAAIATELESPSPQSPRSDQLNTGVKRRATAEMNKPFVRIVEQPASKALRFRYQCEGRSAGSIPGANSTSEVKSYPSIQVCGYKGPAVVLVSCVTKDAPYRPHPHNLVGREGCKGGVCTLQIPPDTMSMTFSNLGIQCVKKRDIADNLDARHKYKVDPFNTGFDHKNQPTSIDLNAVRLCFQVYITNPAKGDNKFSVPLAPVVSDPIYDKKAMCDLTIVKLSDCSSIVDGGKKDIILLCEKVTKEDIEIRFFEEIDGQITWEGKGDFQPSQVHKQTAIWFRAPRYKTLDIIEPVRVNIQLRRPSDGAVSEALPFEMLPLDSGLKRKRNKLDSEPNINLIRPLQEQVANRQSYNTINNRQLDIKEEPLDAQPYVSPVYLGHSPTYAPSSLSPGHQGHHYPPGPVAGANIPIPYYPQQQQQQHNELLPPEHQWNVPLQPIMRPPQMCVPQAAAPNVLEAPMSIDSNDLQQLINSSELAQYNIDTNALSDNLSNNLNLNENIAMTTDSLSRLANHTFDTLFNQAQQ